MHLNGTRFVVAGLSWIALLSVASSQTLPLGGRTASMGGAAAAAGRDGAMPYVNPAGYALVPSTTLSLSASLYRWERVEVDPFFYHGMLDPGLGGLAVEPSPERNQLVSSRFASFPGAASALWHIGPDDPDAGTHHVLSASILVSRNRDLAMEGDFAVVIGDGTSWRETFTRTEAVTTYDIGPGYALKLGDFRLGLVAAFVYTTGGRSAANSILVSSNVAFTTQDGRSFDKFSVLGFQPVLGAQWTLAPGFSIGASIAPASIPITGTREGQGDSSLTVPPGVMESSSIQAFRFDGDHERNLPTRIRAGLAYEVRKDWAIAGDVGIKLARSRAYFMDADVLTVTQAQGLGVDVVRTREGATAGQKGGVSVHAGVEKFISSMLAIRAGGFFEPSIERLAESQSDILVQDVDHWGATLGLGLENDFGEVTFGVAYTHGSGETIAGDAFTQAGTSFYRRVGVESHAVLAFIAGAVDVGELAEWTKIARDPKKLFEVEEGQLHLSDLDPRLAALGRDTEWKALLERPRSYVRTGERDYDRFFERVARIRLAMEAAPVLVDKATADVRAAQEAWSAIPAAQLMVAQAFQHALRTPESPLPPSVASLPDIERLMRLIAAARTLERIVGGLAADLAGLASDGKRLIDQAQHDFEGPGFVRLPGVLKNLAATQSDVAESLQQVPVLITSFEGLLRALTHGASSPPPSLPPPPPLPESSPPLIAPPLIAPPVAEPPSPDSSQP